MFGKPCRLTIGQTIECRSLRCPDHRGTPSCVYYVLFKWSRAIQGWARACHDDAEADGRTIGFFTVVPPVSSDPGGHKIIGYVRSVWRINAVRLTWPLSSTCLVQGLANARSKNNRIKRISSSNWYERELFRRCSRLGKRAQP